MTAVGHQWWRLRTLAALGAVVALCAACATPPSAPAPGGPATAAASHSQAGSGPGNGTLVDLPVPDAALTTPLVDEQGTTFTLDSLKGRTVVLTDFLTTCAEICPMTSVNLNDLAQQLTAVGHGGDVVVLEGTVDPARDDAARLLAYKKLFGARAQLPGWRLFTAGKRTEAFWGALGVGCERKPIEDPAPTDWLTGRKLTYDVEHQDVVFVIDPQGHERWLVSGNPNTRGANPPARLKKFLNDEGQGNLTEPAQPNWSVADLASGLEAVSGIRLA